MRNAITWLAVTAVKGDITSERQLMQSLLQEGNRRAQTGLKTVQRARVVVACVCHQENNVVRDVADLLG